MSEERVYTINLRATRKIHRIERARKAIILVRRHLERHMKGDVVITQQLNEFIWARGIKKPPMSVKVKAVKDGSTIRAELVPLTQRTLATKGTVKGRPGMKKGAKVEKKKEQKPVETKTEKK